MTERTNPRDLTASQLADAIFADSLELHMADAVEESQARGRAIEAGRRLELTAFEDRQSLVGYQATIVGLGVFVIVLGLLLVSRLL